MPSTRATVDGRTPGRAAWFALALALVAATLGGTASAVAAPPSGTPGVIAPGALISVGGFDCTTNFVFTNGPTWFLGTASHCFWPDDNITDAGQCSHGAMALGTPVDIALTDGTTTTGRVAYISGRTMREHGVCEVRSDQNTDLSDGNDFALVELEMDDVRRTDPTVPRFGGPMGVRTTTSPLGRNEPVYSYQGEFGAKAGYRNEADDSAFRYVHLPSVIGNSGSGLLDAQGRAVGVICDVDTKDGYFTYVADMQRVLDYASTYGGLGPIQIVPGRSPFQVPKSG